VPKEPPAEGEKEEPPLDQAPADMVTLPKGWGVGVPVNLGPTVNSAAEDGGPALSTDGLTLVFHSDRPGGFGVRDLWMCIRAFPEDKFGQPVNLGPIVNSADDDWCPALSSDGLTLYFQSTRDGGLGGHDLWMSTRASPEEPFGAPVNLGPTVNSSGGDAAPAVSSDALTIVFHSDRPGGLGRRDLYLCTRASPDEPFGPAVNLGPIVNSGASDGGAVLARDGLTLFFYSDRPGGLGGWDLFACARVSPDEPFGEPVSLGPIVNSTAHDGGPALSADGLSLLFESDRPGGQGSFDLWVCTRLAKRETPAFNGALPARGESPPLAIAPFDAARAKHHQQTWAEYLGAPVETTNSIGMKLVLIPPGEFDMGSSQGQLNRAAEEARAQNRPQQYLKWIAGEGPQHHVMITKACYMGVHEVTVGEFRRFSEATRYQTDAEKDGRGGRGLNMETRRWERDPRFSWQNLGFPQDDEHPVLNVSWNDAGAFCQWISEEDHKTYRLPTEAEWEYACRSGTTTEWNSGDDRLALQQVANIADQSMMSHCPVPELSADMAASWDDGATYTAPVGSYLPNAFGLHDVHGNAWEWCGDWYDPRYFERSPSHDPAGPASGNERVQRGGGWHDSPLNCRSARRSGSDPTDASRFRGFRVACELESTPKLPSQAADPDRRAAE